MVVRLSEKAIYRERVKSKSSQNVKYVTDHGHQLDMEISRDVLQTGCGYTLQLHLLARACWFFVNLMNVLRVSGVCACLVLEISSMNEECWR